MRFRRVIAALVTASAAVLWGGGVTAAFGNADHGAGTVHEGDNEHQAVDTFADGRQPVHVDVHAQHAPSSGVERERRREADVAETDDRNVNRKGGLDGATCG